MYLFVLATVLFTVGVGQMWGWDYNANIYFNNTTCNWTNISFLIGNDGYSCAYSLSKLDNTNLYYRYVKYDGFNDTYFFNENWGSTDCASTKPYERIKNKTHFQVVQEDRKSGGRYYMAATSASSRQSLVEGLPTYTAYLRVNFSDDRSTYNGVVTGESTWAHSVSFDFTGTYMSTDAATAQSEIENLSKNYWGDKTWGYSGIPVTGEVNFELKSIDSNYEIAGWAFEESATAPTYTENLNNVTFNVTGNTMYVAFIRPKEYSVTLNTNSGTINEGNVTSYVYGIGATLPTNVTRTGYAFDGWYDNSSFTGSAVTTIGTSDYGNKEYWAKWTAKTYTITFHNDGADTKTCEVTTSKELEYDNAAQFNAYTTNIPCVEGYTFNGYKTADECGGTQLVNSSGAFLTNVSGYIDASSRWVYADDLDLYICWSTNNHSITYTSPTGGTYTIKVGSAAAVSANTTADYDEQITLAASAGTGYTFTGWTVTGSKTGAISVTNNKFDMPDEDVTVRAIFTANTYDITYKDRGDETFSGVHGDGYPTTHTYGSSTALVSPTKSGYDFLGWYTDEDCTVGPISSVGATAYTADFTLYALWGKTISQNDFYQLYATTNTGVDDIISAASLPAHIKTNISGGKYYCELDAVSTVDVPHDFSALSTSGNIYFLRSSGNTFTISAAKNLKSVRFYGWTDSGNEKRINVSATMVSGSGSAISDWYADVTSTSEVIKEFTLPISTTDGSTARTNYSASNYYDYTFTINGYFFITGMYVETNDGLTLTYSAEDADANVPSAETWAPNERKHLSTTVPTRTGYLFKEWNTAVNGSGDAYHSGDAYTMPSTATTLYAQWVEPIKQNDFYQLYQTTEKTASAIIEAASLPSYITTTVNDQWWWPISGNTDIDVPHNYKDLSRSNSMATLKCASDTYFKLSNVANVKAVHFYGWAGADGRAIATTATIVNGSGTAPTYSNVAIANVNNTVAHYTVDIAGAANYSASTLYDLTFTFTGECTMVGLYVETNDRLTLTYNANGGSGAPSAESWAPNATDHLSSTVPTCPNLTFVGWNAEQDGSGATTYAAGGAYTMPLTATTLYAQWEKTNVALNKTAVAGWSRRGSCSEKNDGEIPDKAVDGNTGTQWVAYGIKSLGDRAFWNAWLAVDLGAVYSLSDFSTVWRSDGGWGTAPSKYIIQVAESKTDAPADFADDVERNNGWLTVAEVNETQTLGGNENNYAFDSYPVHARYVRIAAMDNDNVEMALSEFRLFSDGSDTKVTPIMGTASVYSDLSAGSATLTLTGTDHSGGRLNTFLLQDQSGKNYRAVTNANNRYTITGLDSKRYIFKVWATENGYVSETYATVIVGASSELDPTENLALNKPVHASSYSGTDEPYKANDGKLDNYWVDGVGYSGSKRDSVWWYVDLQDNYALKSVALFWEGAYATHFIMQVRKNTPYSSDEYDDDAWDTFLDYTGDQTDGTTESDVNNYGDTTGAKAAFSILPKGRYVRIRMLDAKNWSWGIKLREVRVYGYGYLPADDEAPVIRTASKNSETLDKTGVIFDVEADDDSEYPVKSYIVKDYTGAKHYVRDESVAGQIIVTGLPTGKDESVSIYAVDSAGNISYPYVVGPFDYVNPTENLALNKTAYAVTEWQASEGIDKANDGSTSTYWTSYGSASHTNDWWYVDLGDFYDISRIEVVWMSGYNSTSYSVQYRQNAPKVDGGTSSEWDAISEFTNVTTGDKSADIASSVSAQYICLRSASNGGDQVRLAEVRVFGSAFGTPDEDAPVWTDDNCAVTSAENQTITMTLEAVDEVDGDIYDFVININNGTTDKDYERTTTALSNEITITDASMIQPCTTYTITAKCYDHVGNEATKVFEDVTTSVSDDYNLALSKTTAAGISEGGDNGQNAVDGNKENQWSGNATGKEDGVNQWMYVDLGQNYNIDSVVIMWGSNDGTWPRDYELQVSYNGTEYRTIVHNDTKDADRTVSFDDLGAKGRYVRVWANTSGTLYGMCITELEVYGACYTEETTYWFMGQGATNTAWSTAANWFGNAMPNIDDDVVLLAPAEVDVTYAQAKSVVIDQSGSNTGSLTIPAGKALVVAGTVKKTTDGSTLSATAAEDITIGSDVTSGNGALVIGDEDGSTKATVQFYTKAGMRDGEWVNQYIGTPFSDETYIKNNYYGMQIYAFNASSGEWVTPRMADDADMTPFVGYDLLSKGYTAGSHTLNMTGTLNASSSDKVMSLTNDKDEAKENMLANSWVAPIVIGEFKTTDFVNADPTIYIFNAGSPEDYDKNNGAIDNAETSTTGAGQYTCIPINTSVEGYHTIPSMQAFSVMTTATSSAASLKLNYKQLVYDPAVDEGITMEKNHAKRRAAAEGETPEIVKLYVRGESGYKDMLWMLVREDFTEGFDGGWDGRKMFGYEEAPQLYAQSEAGELSVGAVSDIEGTVLGFKAGILDDEYTFTFEYDGDEVLYLIDLYKNKYALVRTGEIYTFNDNDIGSHNRFVLTRYKSPQIATDVEPTPDPSLKGREKAVKLIIDDQMYILYRGVMYDATGKRVEERRAE